MRSILHRLFGWQYIYVIALGGLVLRVHYPKKGAPYVRVYGFKWELLYDSVIKSGITGHSTGFLPLTWKDK